MDNEYFKANYSNQVEPEVNRGIEDIQMNTNKNKIKSKQALGNELGEHTLDEDTRKQQLIYRKIGIKINSLKAVLYEINFFFFGSLL